MTYEQVVIAVAVSVAVGFLAVVGIIELYVRWERRPAHGMQETGLCVCGDL